jgi:hypothetical protein
MLAPGLGEGLVSALHDPLRADVDPRSRRHLAEHHQPLAVELVKVLPRRPLRHEVRVRQQHARRIRMRAEHADRLAALHEQRLVGLEPLQRFDDRVEARPVARRTADAAVDDEFGRVLGDLGVEVVVQHPQRGLGEPALRGPLAAARCAQGAGIGAQAIVHGALLHRCVAVYPRMELATDELPQINFCPVEEDLR